MPSFFLIWFSFFAGEANGNIFERMQVAKTGLPKHLGASWSFNYKKLLSQEIREVMTW